MSAGAKRDRWRVTTASQSEAARAMLTPQRSRHSRQRFPAVPVVTVTNPGNGRADAGQVRPKGIDVLAAFAEAERRRGINVLKALAETERRRGIKDKNTSEPVAEAK